MASTDSPARRVLGNKTTNAPIRKQSPSKPIKTSSLPTERLNTPSFGDKQSLPSSDAPRSPRAGQKRRIDEVEDVERNDGMDDSQRSHCTQTLSLLSDSGSETGDVSMDSSNQTKSTTAMSGLSFGASQPESVPLETTFEIIDEVMSQRSRDQLHAITLPQNASQPQAAQPALLRDLSQVSVGMSSFVNFEPLVASQEDGLQSIKQEESSADQSSEQATPISEKSRKETMDVVRDKPYHSLQTDLPKQAERLRTRLQLAFFKVQTNQAAVPFSRLRPISQSRSPQPPANPFSSSPPASPSTAHRPSPETRIAIMRARATMQNKPAVQSLGGLPIPNIVPTAFSARTVYTANLNLPEVPSSPPQTHKSLSRGPSAEKDDDDPTPKAKPAHQPPHTPMQLSSPPGSPERNKNFTVVEKLTRQERDERYNGLTSSVVKGDAAHSLLDLMKGKQQEE